jgi:sn-glycerol 3-phosphate transport system permease protein
MSTVVPPGGTLAFSDDDALRRVRPSIGGVVRVTNPFARSLEVTGAWLLGILWVLPLVYAFWTAFHPPAYSTNFTLDAPLTLANFVKAWQAAPFARYFVNTVLLVTMVLAAQLVLVTLAAYAFARFTFPGRDVLFALVLVQLMIMPDVLIVENYRTMTALGIKDTILSIGLPYMASAFGIFLLRQTFKTVPRELDEAARVEGCSPLSTLWKVYVPLARPTYIAYGLVSISYHWNNFLWPLIITNSVESRPVTVGLQVFSATDQGIDWSIISAATLMTSGPLLVAFLLFQRPFVQSFMRAGIRCWSSSRGTCNGAAASTATSIPRASCRKRIASRTSTCCACRRSPTTTPTRDSPAATAAISSPVSPNCCRIARRSPASRSISRRTANAGGASAT